MSSLVSKAGIVGLEFHVDYWDTPEWHDPFDSNEYSRRQLMLAKRGNNGQSYTPQIWLDGNLWHNWPTGTPPTPYSGPKPTIQLDATLSDALKLHIVVTNQVSPKQQIFAAVTENSLTEDVLGGENKGKRLVHNEVVRAFAGPFNTNDINAELKFSKKTDLSKSSLVAFSEDETTGKISQAVRLPLNQCIN